MRPLKPTRGEVAGLGTGDGSGFLSSSSWPSPANRRLFASELMRRVEGVWEAGGLGYEVRGTAAAAASSASLQQHSSAACTEDVLLWQRTDSSATLSLHVIAVHPVEHGGVWWYRCLDPPPAHPTRPSLALYVLLPRPPLLHPRSKRFPHGGGGAAGAAGGGELVFLPCVRGAKQGGCGGGGGGMGWSSASSFLSTMTTTTGGAAAASYSSAASLSASSQAAASSLSYNSSATTADEADGAATDAAAPSWDIPSRAEFSVYRRTPAGAVSVDRGGFAFPVACLATGRCRVCRSRSCRHVRLASAAIPSVDARPLAGILQHELLRHARRRMLRQGVDDGVSDEDDGACTTCSFAPPSSGQPNRRRVYDEHGCRAGVGEAAAGEDECVACPICHRAAQGGRLARHIVDCHWRTPAPTPETARDSGGLVGSSRYGYATMLADRKMTADALWLGLY